MSTTDKGFAFSMDLAVTAIVIMLMLFLLASASGSKSSHALQQLKRFQLQKNGIFLADAIVKNSAGNALMGAALFDEEKHRVRSNELQLEKLKMAVPPNSSEFFVQGVSIKWRNGKTEKMVFADYGKKNCIALERAGLIGNETVLVGLLFCER